MHDNPGRSFTYIDAQRLLITAPRCSACRHALPLIHSNRVGLGYGDLNLGNCSMIVWRLRARGTRVSKYRVGVQLTIPTRCAEITDINGIQVRDIYRPAYNHSTHFFSVGIARRVGGSTNLLSLHVISPTTLVVLLLGSLYFPTFRTFKRWYYECQLIPQFTEPYRRIIPILKGVRISGGSTGGGREGRSPPRLGPKKFHSAT